MRECWVNVYVLRSGKHQLGWECRTLFEAERAAQNMREAGVSGPDYRLHVRLKPEPVKREEWEWWRGIRHDIPFYDDVKRGR